ncbi:MAG: S41 family peptidase [Akkermansiaceae bacterium]
MLETRLSDGGPGEPNVSLSLRLSAGTLQDLKRAKVIGETSYGKGSVQNIIPIPGWMVISLFIVPKEKRALDIPPDLTTRAFFGAIGWAWFG